jgi:hypothetical protein
MNRGPASSALPCGKSLAIRAACTWLYFERAAGQFYIKSRGGPLGDYGYVLAGVWVVPLRLEATRWAPALRSGRKQPLPSG